MRYLYFFIVLLCFANCKDAPTTELSTKSVGEYNSVLVVVNDRLWYGNVGDSIREYLAASVDGISPSEPLFTIEQISPNLFSSKTKNRRNIIVFSDNHNEELFALEKNKFASPQNYFVVNGGSKLAVVKTFKKNVDSIIKTMHHLEVATITEFLNASKLIDREKFEDRFKITINVPSDYKEISSNEHFVWFKKDVASGNSNILIYDVPISRILNDKNTELHNILAVKDSVNGRYIHSIEDNSFMKLNEGFIPFNKEISFDNRKAIELKGTWDMQNSFMSGPYLSYVFRDSTEKRYLFIEGLVYNPSMGKRNVLLELEAIIQTMRFKIKKSE
ncbi:DUF4837 family protein [Myroides phaeus]|uniref:DUF4837 domain-containing protein n=1 Tax=Myroides phaeus TaxID=702745 RepID=A0A1G8B3G3_9FLAO|nr:DUF4837 family protein [Myroides phaeus]SDH27716.1 protein of unknown function [Myroides phaeus]